MDDAEGDSDEHRGRWTAIGRIIGPALPAKIASVGEMQIIPVPLVPDESLRRLPARPLPGPTLSFEEQTSGNEPDSVSVSPPIATIRSRWIFTIEVDADGVDDAEEKVRVHLKNALSALHLVSTEPYIADILRYEGGPSGINQSGWVGGFVQEVQELRDDDIAEANRLLPKVDESTTSRVAGDFIRKAASLSRSSLAVAELGPSVLLNLFLAIERIADAMTKNLRKELETDLARETEQAAARLRAALLNDEVTDTQAIELIREASKEFSRIRFFYVDLKIEKAGMYLGLDEALVKEAREFSRFRNQYLGHPRSDIPPEQLRHWSENDLAFRLSNAFLRAYLLRSD